MTAQKIDLDKLRTALRKMSRGDLLMVAERAIEILPKTKLGTLVGDMVRLEDLTRGKPDVGSLLDEVRKFHRESLAGEYFDGFAVNSKNFMNMSEGTGEFMEDFDRLLTGCIRAATKGPHGAVREAFELLLELLRQLDRDPDSVIFFADEGGSWQVGVDWREALAAYFRCLAGSASAEEFAREVDRAITDFADYERPKHLAAARRVAGAEQKAALRRLPRRTGRR